MYGISNTDEALDEDLSEKNPLTEYARTKWEAELALMAMRVPGFEVTALRPSTVFGASPRLRCDIVFNSLVACAFTTGSIEVKSDGTPRRPAVHVLDLCEAFIAGLEAETRLVDGRSFNVGVADGNSTVRELAVAAQVAVPGADLVFTGEHGTDSRTYTVSFDRILDELSNHFVPAWDLARGGRELHNFFIQNGFDEARFRGGACNRLVRIGELQESGRIDDLLRVVEG
jgi:nucleoside-diphosphate-sugar epimerase